MEHNGDVQLFTVAAVFVVPGCDERGRLLVGYRLPDRGVRTALDRQRLQEPAGDRC